VSSAAVQPIVALLSDLPGGNPTQYMIEKAFEHHQLDWRYLTVEVRPDDLADAVRGMRAMGFRGGHCGHPHKKAVLPLLDRLSDTAETIGAANVILREDDQLLGENTEGKGLLAMLKTLADPAGMRIVLLGAGKAGRAAALELAQAAAAEITVVNRTVHRAGQLAEVLSEKFQIAATPLPWQDDFALPAETDLLVNATSIGRNDPQAAVPLSLDGLESRTIVADMTPDPPQTPLLRQAADRGCQTLDGLSMYIEQTAVAFQRWTTVDPDRHVMREAIEEFLEL